MVAPLEWDEDTGLPALPEGFFWRITKDGTYHMIEIRKNVTVLRRFRAPVEDSVRVHSHPLELLVEELRPRRIKEAAAYVLGLSEVQVKIGLRLPAKDNGTHLYGDYPPRTLNVGIPNK